MVQEENKQKQEKINNRYWDEFTKKSSAYYEEKMNELDGIKGLRRDDSYNGHKAPKHMMYKLETLRREDGAVGYEFLIEYKTTEPTVGIYYGCKCLFPEGVEPSPYIDQFNKEWKMVKNEVLTLLNNTFPDKDFSHRFKATNNANDGTYWPFWITLYEDEDIREVGLRATKIIRDVYKRLLEEKKYAPYEEPKPKDKCETLTAFTNEAFDELVRAIAENISGESKVSKYESSVSEIIEKFIKRAVEENLLIKVTAYEKAWATTLQTNEFACLIKALYDFIKQANDIDVKGKNKTVPWENMCRIFMDKRQKVFGDTLKNSCTDKSKNKKLTKKFDGTRVPPTEKWTRAQDEEERLKKLLE